MNVDQFLGEILRYFVTLLMLVAASARLRDTAGVGASLASLFGLAPALRALLAPVVAPAEQAGLAIWIVSPEPAWRLRQFLGGALPLSRVLRVTRRDYRLLNAMLASPAYLMVGHDGVLEASGMIGDGRDLRAQLADSAPAPA